MNVRVRVLTPDGPELDVFLNPGQSLWFKEVFRDDRDILSQVVVLDPHQRVR